jgi:hypothetical protein
LIALSGVNCQNGMDQSDGLANTEMWREPLHPIAATAHS